MFVVVAQWYAKAGADDQIAEILKTAVRNSRTEPGCVLFMANRSVDEPRKFVLYEQFADRAGRVRGASGHRFLQGAHHRPHPAAARVPGARGL